MASSIALALKNGPAWLRGIAEAKALQVRYMRGEMKRGAQRIRKTFIKTRLQGPPGIKAGKLAKGKNVFTFVGGRSAGDVYGKIGISRILHVHEEGMTIRPTEADSLMFENKAKTGMVSVKQVVIPARLKFREHVAHESPAQLVKVAEASVRATETAMRKALNASVRTL